MAAMVTDKVALAAILVLYECTIVTPFLGHVWFFSYMPLPRSGTRLFRDFIQILPFAG